jgi:hypothetical protein
MAGRLAGACVVGGGAACVPCAVAIMEETRRTAANPVAILRYCAGMLLSLDKDWWPTSLVASWTA